MSAGHSSECVQGLNLSIMSPWNRSFRDERGIEKAISFINHSPYSAREALDLLREAIKWSISSAAGRDTQKQEFLEAVAQGNDSRFLQDVAEEYQHQNSSPRYEGDCGYPIGSGSYLSYMEKQVFDRSLPFLNNAASGNADYERLILENLRSIAHQLERDLDNAIRENDYITDETADKLKAVVSELDHCGVSTGSLSSKIDKLAWFVGGDPSEIKQLQRALNDLGVGQHLEENGVFGKETKEAVDRMIDRFSAFLTDADKLRQLDQTIDIAVSALDCVLGARGQIQGIHNALEKGRRDLQRTIWKLGAEYYLRPKGYNVAALLLEHSLEPSPSNLYFSQSHWVTQKIIQSRTFQNILCKLENLIKESPDTFATTGKIDADFQATGDTDLYYGIGRCSFKYTCTKLLSAVRIMFTMEDEYDFDHIRSISGDVNWIVAFHFSPGNLANDAGLFSQADGVISTYYLFVSFEKIIEL